MSAYGIRFDFPGDPKYVGLAATGALTWTTTSPRAIRFENSVDAVRVLTSYHPALSQHAQVVELDPA